MVKYLPSPLLAPSHAAIAQVVSDHDEQRALAVSERRRDDADSTAELLTQGIAKLLQLR